MIIKGNMDLYAELQQATNDDNNEEEGNLNLEVSQENSKAFIEAVIECCKQTRDDYPYHTMEYDGRYTMTSIPEKCYTPFTNAVGLSNRKTVIISKLSPEPQNISHDAPHNDSQLNITTNEDSSPATTQPPPFTTYNRRSILISNSMGQKASYITKNETFPASSITSLFLNDEGAEPISSDEARYFCSLYSIYCYSNNATLEALPDIWVLCDGSPVLSMGCCINELLPNTLDLYQIIKGSDVTIPDSNTYSLSLDSPPFNDRIGVRRTGTSKRNHKVITAKYNFGVTAVEGIPSVKDMSGVCITIDFIWNGKDAVFSPPSSTAEAVLGVSVTPGYQMSPVLGVYMEISTLLTLCEVACGKETWAMKYGMTSDDDESLLESNDATLLSKVESFLEDASVQMLKSVEMAVVTSPTVELSPFQPREDLDFVGQLWMFLRHVTNLEDLVESLGAVFKAIILGKIHPFIHRSKSSTLANLFRQSLSSNSTDEREVIATKLQNLLTEEKALQCLVEIGLDKLQRDFVAFFGLGGLATMNDLEVYFKSSDLLQRCHSLCCLQYVLELASVLSTFISLPLSSLSFFVRDALRYYRSVDFQGFVPSPVFNIHFPSMSTECKALATLVSSLTPVSWSATITDSAQHSPQHRRMFCVEEPLFSRTSEREQMEQYEKEDEGSAKLYLYHVKHQSTEL